MISSFLAPPNELSQWRNEKRRYRHDQERLALKSEKNEARLGQIFGFMIGVLALVAGTVPAGMGAETAGGFIGAGGVVGLAAVFVYGRSVRK